MTHDPRKPEDDQTFERDLESVQSAWEHMEKAEPPSLVDKAVLNAARRDLEPVRKMRPLRWLGGFATATVVVLAFTLFLEQEQQIPLPVEIESMQREQAPTPAREKSTGQLLEQVPLPAAEPRAQARAAKREEQPLRMRAAPEKEQPPGQENTLQKKDMGFRQLAAPAGTMADAVQDPQAAMSGAKLPATAESIAEEESMLSAENWVEVLLELHEAGRTEELATELAAFREAYPDYTLPPELAGLEP
jgi:hypothetical protein